MRGRAGARPKYHNKKAVVDGIAFDSRGEAGRYRELKLLERGGAIQGLRLQVPFELQPAFRHEGKRERAITYIADFVYAEGGKTVIEDFKGHKTKEYLIKRKLLLKKIADGEIDAEFREIKKGR